MAALFKGPTVLTAAELAAPQPRSLTPHAGSRPPGGRGTLRRAAPPARAPGEEMRRERGVGTVPSAEPQPRPRRPAHPARRGRPRPAGVPPPPPAELPLPADAAARPRPGLRTRRAGTRRVPPRPCCAAERAPHRGAGARRK